MKPFENDPEWKAWAARIARDVVPMIDGSAVTISFAPGSGKPDIKYAVELGLSIMLDKPIMIVADVGQVLPGKLERIADEIVRVDRGTPEAIVKIADAIQRMQARFP